MSEQKIVEVRKIVWANSHGIAHLIAVRNGHWMATACNMAMTGAKITAKPKRLCRKCRAMLEASQK